MGFETYEEMEAFADSLEQSDLEAHDVLVWQFSTGQGVPAEPRVVGYRPYEYSGTTWVLSHLEKESGREDSNIVLTDTLLAELELRGVPVWRCDGCDRWLADTERAHVLHSVECGANGS